jgi:sarcosine oxidase subunit gamma
MAQPVEYRSPIHGTLLGAIHACNPGQKTAALRQLALCDLSALPKLGVKGAGAEAWLREQGIEVPPATYDTRALESAEGVIVRLGVSDFFLEGGISDNVLSRLSAELARFPPQVYRVERQDATILLTGERAPEVLAQLCSIDFRSAPVGRVCLTRVGGVSCAVLPQASEAPLFRLWVDYTYAVAFWEALVEVSGELGGQIVG